MKKIILSVCGLVLCMTSHVFATESCFLLQENTKILKAEGDCHTRYSPCSSFKLPLALMGYDSGILKDKTHPTYPFKEGYPASLEVWKQAQNPTTWIKYSCVWYSQVLTQKLGMQRFQNYVQKFHYGNQDLSGDKGTNNGLTRAWLSSSLEISPEEQAIFLEKLLFNKLPVSIHAQQMTRNIAYIEDLPNGWRLYGKTGSGNLLSQSRTLKLDIQHGWFIGWIEKDNRRIRVVNHIVDQKKQKDYAGLRAKQQAKEKLLNFIRSANKNPLTL